MDVERWAELKDTFEVLVQLSAEEQAQRMAVLAGTDPDLCQRLKVLLAADARADALQPLERVPSPGAEPEPADQFGLAGRTVSHFRVRDVLGCGGMGVVYRAEDLRLGRTVALKFLLPQYSLDAHAKERFLQEARASSALDHPNVCTVHEAGESEQGQLFLAMGCYGGETLKARLARTGPLPLADAVEIARQVLLGLSAAHAAGVVHRDVKPGNLMLTPGGTVKILDFGLAKVRDLHLTSPEQRPGTVAYMSPEQLQGKALDARTDLWSLGVVFYEMLTGRTPFGGGHDLSTLYSVLHQEPAPPSTRRKEIPDGLDQLVAKLLRKEPQERYATAAEVLAELELEIVAPRSSALVPEATRRRLVLAASLILSAALLIALGARLREDDEPPISTRPTVAVVAAESGDDPSASRMRHIAATAVARRLASADVAAPLPIMEAKRSDAGAVAVRAGARLIVAITTMQIGETPYIDATLTDVRNGALLWRSPRIAALPGSEIAVADVLAERSATAVAVRLDPSFQNWISASSEPSSIESYRDFRSALRLHANFEWEGAAELLARTMARDTAFTMAAIEWVLVGMNMPAVRPHVDSVLARMKGRDLMPHDRAIVDYLAANRSGDFEIGYTLSAAIAATAPRSEWRFLQANAAVRVGRPRQGVRVLDEMRPHLGWLADGPWYWYQLGAELHFAGAYERELAEMEEARRRFPSNRIIVQMHIKALAALGREQEVMREVSRALAMRPRWAEDIQPMHQAVVELRAHGYPDAARRLAAWTVGWIGDGPPERRHELRSDMPVILFEAGRVSEARAAMAEVIAADSTDAYGYAMLGVMYAAEGNRAAAQREDARLARLGGPQGLVLMGRAGIAAWLGDRERAVRLLRDALSAGLEWRPVLHLDPLLAPLRGYEPFEELIRPVD